MAVFVGNVFAVTMLAFIIYGLFFKEDDGDDHGA